MRHVPSAAMLLEIRASANPSMLKGRGLKVRGTSLAPRARHRRAATIAPSVLNLAGSPPGIAVARRQRSLKWTRWVAVEGLLGGARRPSRSKPQGDGGR